MATRALILFMVPLLLICVDLTAQVRKYAYQQLTESQGLSQNFVYGLTQDARGFLWISTGAGVTRYDGYEMKRFSTHDSLSADFITADYKTASGNLIFGHNNGGVTFFDGTKFEKLLPDTLNNKVVSVTECDADRFWIATQSRGLIFVDYRQNKVTSVFPKELEGQIINTLYCRANSLWVGTNEGLFLFKVRGNTVTHLERELLPPYVSVNAILPHSTDPSLIWIGTGFKGIYLVRYNASDTEFNVLNTYQLPEFSEDIIQTMAQDSDGDLWVGTRQNGVVHLNLTRDGQSIFKASRFRRRTGFPFISVNKLIIDRQGQIWVSTMGDGVFKIYKELIAYFPMAKDYGVSEVRSIAEVSSGYMVGTNAGLLKISLNSQSDEYEVRALDMLKGEPILSLFTDGRHNTWIGTETQGVFVYSDETKKLERVIVDQANEPIEARLFEDDNEGNIWISARANGVYLLNEQRTPVRHLTTANKFIHNDVFAIKADSKGNVWFGTYGAGLAMLRKNEGLILLSTDDMLRARDINDIDEDNEGNVWVATEGEGFFKYADKTFTQVGSGDNLVSPFIKGIHFDPSGRIWFSYRKGLGYFDLRSSKKHHYTVKDGLLANEAYSSSIIVDSKFNKWFCNDFGVTLFEHDTVSDDRKALETYITGVRIFFKDYPAPLMITDSTNVEREPQLNLSHDNNHVTFDFVAIKLNRTGNIYYRHFLEGYDSEWTPPSTANFVTYTNLDPGKYVLKVQASDDLSAWVDPVTTYSFVITPPYWRRTWFYFLQIISVVSLFTLTYFLGKKGIATKRYVLRLMLFSSFFITLEYVENFVDPLVSDSFGGAPVFRFFLNFLLALLLLPVETLITHWLMDRQSSDLTNEMAHMTEEAVLMEQDRMESPRE